MKRCPHCEFIYNDDQTACDMDGQMLVFDNSTTLPAITTHPQSPRHSRTAFISLLAITGLVLVIVASLTFMFTPGPIAEVHADTLDLERAITLPPLTSPLRKSEPLHMAAAEPSVAASTDVSTEAAENETRRNQDARLTIRRGLPPLPRLQPLPRLPAAKPTPRVVEVKQEKNSKVKSLLKKTGRVLKKPFKF